MFRSISIILQMATVLGAMATNLPINVGEGYCPSNKEVHHDILGCFAATLSDEECLNKDHISLGRGGRHGRCLCDTRADCNATEGLDLGTNGYDRYSINNVGLPMDIGEGYCSDWKEVRHDLLGCFAAILLDQDCFDKEEISFGRGDDASRCMCDTVSNCNDTEGLVGLDLDPDGYDRFRMPNVPAPPSDWMIRRNESSVFTAVLADGEQHEVSMEFEVRNGYGQQVQVSLYESDCETHPVPADSIAVTHNLTHTGGDWNLLDVALDVKEDIIKNSTLWIQDAAATGTIAACLLFELLSEDMNFASVYFYKYPLNMTVDMRKDFGVDGIQPTSDADAPSGEELEFDVDYTVTACQCDGVLPPICEVDAYSLMTNAYFHLCISPDSDEVEINSVNMLSLQQDGDDIAYPITDGRTDALTTVRKGGGHAVVSMTFTTYFYMSLNASDVLAQGEVALEFAPSFRRRMMETGRTRAHVRQSTVDADAGKAPFEVELELPLNEQAGTARGEPITIRGDDSLATMMSVIGSVGATILLALILVVWRRRGRSAEE